MLLKTLLGHAYLTETHIFHKERTPSLRTGNHDHFLKQKTVYTSYTGKPSYLDANVRLRLEASPASSQWVGEGNKCQADVRGPGVATGD